MGEESTGMEGREPYEWGCKEYVIGESENAVEIMNKGSLVMDVKKKRKSFMKGRRRRGRRKRCKERRRRNGIGRRREEANILGIRTIMN